MLVTDAGNNANAGDVFVATLPAPASRGRGTVGNVANLTTTVSGLTLDHSYQFDFYYAPFDPKSTCKLEAYGGVKVTRTLTAQ